MDFGGNPTLWLPIAARPAFGAEAASTAAGGDRFVPSKRRSFRAVSKLDQFPPKSIPHRAPDALGSRQIGDLLAKYRADFRSYVHAGSQNGLLRGQAGAVCAYAELFCIQMPAAWAAHRSAPTAQRFTLQP